MKHITIQVTTKQWTKGWGYDAQFFASIDAMLADIESDFNEQHFEDIVHATCAYTTDEDVSNVFMLSGSTGEAIVEQIKEKLGL